LNERELRKMLGDRDFEQLKQQLDEMGLELTDYQVVLTPPDPFQLAWKVMYPVAMTHCTCGNNCKPLIFRTEDN
jgi:hypothetical protein